MVYILSVRSCLVMAGIGMLGIVHFLFSLEDQGIKMLLLELIYILHLLYRAFYPLCSVLKSRGCFFFSSEKLKMGNAVICRVLCVCGGGSADTAERQLAHFVGSP